jgi:plastocyanin
MKKLLFLALLLPLTVLAVETDYVLVIKDHQFQPAELTVPAGKKIKVVIENRDASPEEFESHSLNREKLIAANASVSIYIGPLSVGRYPFYGEFNEATAQGVIVAK